MRVSRIPSFPLALLLLFTITPTCSAMMSLPTLGTAAKDLWSASAGQYVAFAGGTDINDTALLSVRVYDTASDNEATYVLTPDVPPLAIQGIGGAYIPSQATAYFLVVLTDATPSITQWRLLAVDKDVNFVSVRGGALPGSAYTRMSVAGADYDPITAPAGGWIAVVGGEFNGLPVDSVWWMDLRNASGVFQNRSGLITPVSRPNVAGCDGTLVVTGGRDATGLSPQILYLVTASDAAAVVVQQYESHTLGVLCSNVSTSAYLFGGFNSTDGQYTPTVISVDGNGVQSRVLSAAVRQTPRKDAAGGCGSKSCTFVGGWNQAGAVDAVDVLWPPTLQPSLESRYPFVVTRHACAVSRVTDVLVCAGGISVANLPTSSVIAFGYLRRLSSGILPTPAWDMAVGAANDAVVFAGGCTAPAPSTVAFCQPIDVIQAYNITSRTYATTALSVPRSQIAVASTTYWIVFAGGVDLSAPVGQVDFMRTDVFSKPQSTASAAMARVGMAAASVKTYAVFSGGALSFNFLDPIKLSAEVTIFDCSSASSLPTQTSYPLSSPVWLSAAVGFSDSGQIVISGGERASVVSGVVVILPPNGPKDGIGIDVRASGLFLAASPSSAVMMGGTDGTRAANPIIRPWLGGQPSQLTTTLYQPVTQQAGAQVPRRGIAMICGGDASGQATNEAAIIDNGHIARLKLAAPRLSHSAISVRNFVIVGGGRVKATPVASIEFFSLGTVPTCTGSAPAPSAVCVDGTWVVTPGVLSQVNTTTGQVIVINGSLSLLPNATVIITVTSLGEPLISVSEVLILDGELTIVLSTDLADGSEIAIASAAEINGTFTQITVTPSRSCQLASATPKQTLTTYSIVLSVDSSRCDSGGGRSLSGAVIAGIVVGVVIFAAIAAVVILMVVKRINPRSLLFRQPAKTRSQMDYDIYAN